MATKKETDKKVVEKADHKDGEKADKKSKKASGTTKKTAAKKPVAKKVAAKKASAKKPAAKKASKEESSKEKASKGESSASVNPTKKIQNQRVSPPLRRKKLSPLLRVFQTRAVAGVKKRLMKSQRLRRQLPKYLKVELKILLMLCIDQKLRLVGRFLPL